MEKNTKPTLLVIDDSGFMRLRMKKIFSSDFNVYEASDGEEGLKKIQGRAFKIDLVLLDINMPGLSGIDVLKILNEDGRFKSLPIIIFSGEEDLQLAALENGAWDFVSKDEAPRIIQTRVKNVVERSLMNKVKRENVLINSVLLNIINYSQDLIFEWDTKRDSIFFIGNISKNLRIDSEVVDFIEKLENESFIYTPDIRLFKQCIKSIDKKNHYAKEELRILLNSGEIRWCKFTFYGEFDDSNTLVKIVGIATDVHAFKEAIDEATNKAEHDSLTGLVNRAAYENYYEILNAQLINTALILIDVDNFKSVNDSIGHIGGDYVLQIVAKRLQESFRDSDCVARIGGDEFAIIMNDVKSKDSLKDKLDLLYELVRKEFDFNGRLLHQNISAGALYIDKENKLSYLEAYKAADDALYKSKSKGRNCYTIVERNN